MDGVGAITAQVQLPLIQLIQLIQLPLICHHSSSVIPLDHIRPRLDQSVSI